MVGRPDQRLDPGRRARRGRHRPGGRGLPGRERRGRAPPETGDGDRLARAGQLRARALHGRRPHDRDRCVRCRCPCAGHQPRAARAPDRAGLPAGSAPATRRRCRRRGRAVGGTVPRTSPRIGSRARRHTRRRSRRRRARPSARRTAPRHRARRQPRGRGQPGDVARAARRPAGHSAVPPPARARSPPDHGRHDRLVLQPPGRRPQAGAAMALGVRRPL